MPAQANKAERFFPGPAMRAVSYNRLKLLACLKGLW
jgi:hypothetical protein